MPAPFQEGAITNLHDPTVFCPFLEGRTGRQVDQRVIAALFQEGAITKLHNPAVFCPFLEEGATLPSPMSAP